MCQRKPIIIYWQVRNGGQCQKAEKECKYWLDRGNFALQEAYIYNMNNRDKRDVKKIVFEYFEFIEHEWDRF